jgi:hypothetical protein
MKKEESLQIAVSNYLRLQYPGVIFTSESSGIRLTIGQAIKAKKQRSNCKLPDMIILEPKGDFKGLCLELKKEGEKVFQKNGEPYSGHIKEQYETLKRLSDKGYFAGFVCGFDHAKKIIDTYMGLN